ncbi:GNAT family N-acetyltransferase [Frigidibacter sp. RF13]|uniref:GNAT family N-acetyltransferase n=1 Tax=Frigidibacter sp. RF13 TaxID=2997340 RepID=UPI00226F3019|nr:GNAT family N-acetyltransferase [Frigidibacter sp. RF13]MCY1128051.1 GNAT family N-acetyltransferase [Frigidibacter sp. RF13]
MTNLWEQPPNGRTADAAAAFAALVPVIETERLRLRAPGIGDFDAWAGIECGDRGVGIGGPMSRADSWLDFAQATATWLLRGHGLWSVESRNTGALLGFVLIGFEPGDQEPELGFLFTEAAEGQGYAFEAAKAARAHAFGALGFVTIVSYIAPDNDRSIRLAERLGAARDTAAEVDIGNECLVYRHPNPGKCL